MARGRKPDAAPLEEVEWEPRPEPSSEPFKTLLGEGGPMPEAEYLTPARDPTGAADLWRALESLGSEPPPRTASAQARGAIVASWRAPEPMPTFQHRHGRRVVEFDLMEPESLQAEVSHRGRILMRCPTCRQVVLITREGPG